MPKVSIIMPVYNAEQYLRDCLESVLRQTICDLELLCTDDGSTDASLAILEEYAAKDERIRIFHQANQGAGPARNMGLANATGEYVVFMDGDDFYPANDTLEKMYAAAKEYSCRVVAGYRSLLTEDGEHDDKNDPLYRLALQHPQGAVIAYRDVQFDFNYQCYMFQRQLLTENAITFPDYRRCQDPPFLVRAMIGAVDFFLVPFASYTYRWGHQNIQWTKRKINDLVKAHIDLLQISRSAELNILHRNAASRLEKRYKDIIVSCLNAENLELFALMAYANSITDFEWLVEKGAPKRASEEYDSVKVLSEKLATIIVIGAAKSDAFLADCIDEIAAYYQALPNAQIRKLNNLFIRVLSKFVDPKKPYYIRKLLFDYLSSPVFAAISTNCDETQSDVWESKDRLIAIQRGFTYCNRLQEIRNMDSHNSNCVFSSTTSAIPLVSVIVSIYNVENYVAECLQSLVRQTFKDIEIICVDDGSTDSSLSIVMEYAVNNPNFVVIQQANGGLSAARNTGLKYARGTYIHFLDSDDSMKLSSYELLLEKAVPNQLDLLFFDGEANYEDEQLKREYPWYTTGYTSKSVGDSITDGGEYFLNAIVQNDFRVSACMYIFRREFLIAHDIRFIEGIVHEDNYFTYACALLSRRTSHLTAPLYIRRVQRGSITIQGKCFRHAYGYFYSYLALRNFLDCTPIDTCLKDVASINLIDVLKNAQYEYEKIADAQERLFYLSLPTVEAEQFFLMVVNPVQELQAKKKALYEAQEKLKKAKTNIVKASSAQAMKPAARKSLILRGIQCCKDHGVRYSIMYSLKKIRKKLHGGIQCCKDHGFLYTLKHAFRKLL